MKMKVMTLWKKPIASETSNIPEHLQHLNKNLLAKIRAKTEEKKILEGRYDKQHSKLQQQWESLPYLLNLIRGVYLAEKKSAIPWEKLIPQLKKKHKNGLIDENDLQLQLDLLNGLTTKFFQVKQSRTMKIAKIDLKIDMNSVRNEINRQIEFLAHKSN